MHKYDTTLEIWKKKTSTCMLCYVQAPLVPQTIPQPNLYIQIPTWKEGFLVQFGYVAPHWLSSIREISQFWL
jgi:hypothetical protein